MKKNNFFEVAPPYHAIDRLAAAVTKPAHIDDTFHKDNKELGRSESVNPIPWRAPFPSEMRNGSIDFTGLKYGRSTVLGIQKDRVAKNHRWVLRCSCGTYLLRTAKALRTSTRRETFACYDCITLARLKRHDYVRRTGKEADTEDFL